MNLHEIINAICDTIVNYKLALREFKDFRRVNEFVLLIFTEKIREIEDMKKHKIQGWCQKLLELILILKNEFRKLNFRLV